MSKEKRPLERRVGEGEAEEGEWRMIEAGWQPGWLLLGVVEKRRLEAKRHRNWRFREGERMCCSMLMYSKIY